MPVYVQHEALGKVDDVFDADALWRAPGLALFARRPLLRDLLERSPRELRGRAATRCFSHVTLVLPQDDVDDDRHLTRGARVRDLAQGLAALHQKDFGDLLGGDEVRYRVVGAERLAPGEVEVKFGHALYLPAPAERVQYTVSVSRDSAVWKTVCAIYPNQRLTLIGNDEHGATCAAPGWPFGDEGALLLINDGPDAPLEVQVRPKEAFDCAWDADNGYYCIRSRRGAVDGAGLPLRLLLLVTPAEVSPTAAHGAGRAGAGMPSAPAAARPIAGKPEGGLRAGAGAPAGLPTASRPAMKAPVPPAAGADAPLPPLSSVSGRTSAAVAAAAVPVAPPMHTSPVLAAQAAPRPVPASAPAATPPAASARPAVWKPRRPAAADMTAAPLAPPTLPPAAAPRALPSTQAEADATFAPVARQRVVLAALALPRLSRYRETGARALQIGLDHALNPSSRAGDAILSLAVDADDGLFAVTAAGRERIAAPARFHPFDGGAVELAAPPPAMADRYCAVLHLPQAPALPVAPGARFAFGRGAPVLAGLRVLDDVRFLTLADGVPACSADRLGLSRNAFSFEAAADGYRIARLSPTQALYHLDAALGFVAEVGTAMPEQPYLLPAGHHLVAGHYVLRFDA